MVRKNNFSQEKIEQIGEGTERKAARTLWQLYKDGAILGFRRATAIEDMAGTDFIVYYRFCGCSANVPLQIKTSKHQLSEHRRKYPNIPAVVMGGKFDVDRFKAEVLEAVQGWVKPSGD